METLLISGALDSATPPQVATKELLPYLPNGHQVVLPAFGMISEIVPVFSGKPLFGYRSMVAATMGKPVRSTESSWRGAACSVRIRSSEKRQSAKTAAAKTATTKTAAAAKKRDQQRNVSLTLVVDIRAVLGGTFEATQAEIDVIVYETSAVPIG